MLVSRRDAAACTQGRPLCDMWLACRRGPRWNPAAGHEAVPEVSIAVPMAPEQAYPRSRHMQYLALGAAAALSAQYALQWLGHTPWWQRVSRRFIWWRPDEPAHSPYGTYAGKPAAPSDLSVWADHAGKAHGCPPSRVFQYASYSSVLQE